VKTKFSAKENSLCFVFAFLLPFYANAQGMRGSDLASTIKWHDELASRFKAGDTNVPLLSMAWFFSGVWFCNVDQAGGVSAGLDTGHSIRGGLGKVPLNETNRALIVQLINSLPPPPSQLVPDERKIVLSGIRSNQWFQNIYDRANVPKEVEQLYEITGSQLVWFFRQLKGVRIAHSDLGHFVCAARGVPIAVLLGQSRLQVLDMSSGNLTDRLRVMPYDFGWSPLDRLVMSPDGKLLVYATHYGVHGIDLKTKKQLWQKGHLERDGLASKELAIGSDKDQFLFASGAHTLERWDLATGRYLATLATNQPGIEFLEVSRNGRVLVAGFDNNRSIAIWEVEKNEPIRRITEPGPAGIGVSPDGETIAISVYGHNKLQLFNWRSNETKEVPMRIPYASYHFISIYWSSDGKQVAACIDSDPRSIVLYDAATWKPFAQWICGGAFGQVEFVFADDNNLVQLKGPEIFHLEVPRKSLSEN